MRIRQLGLGVPAVLAGVGLVLARREFGAVPATVTLIFDGS